MNNQPPCSRPALIAVALVLAANVVVPLVLGDVYPFTSAPMFRDGAERCCNYRVYAPDGRELPTADWLVQRIYDGNPVGYGVGRRPPAVIEQKFGVVADEAAVRRHIERQFQRGNNGNHAWVEVVQEIIGPVDGECVGVCQTHRWRFVRP